MPPPPSSSAPRHHLHHHVAINTTNISSSPPTAAAAIITHHHPYHHSHATIDVHHKETLLYERESLTLEDVLSILNSRELKKRAYAKDDGDGLFIRERPDQWGNQGCGSSRSKSKGKGTYKMKCCICYYEDNMKKDCPQRNKKKSTTLSRRIRDRVLIMDSNDSYHRRDYLFDFKEFNGGTVLLSDNRACAIVGTWKVRVQMKDGLTFVLENVRYIPKLKGNLISLGTLDREGYTLKMHNGRVKRMGNISEAGLHELERKEVLGNKGLEAAVTTAYLINRFWKKVEFEMELQGSKVEPTVDPHTRENPIKEVEEKLKGSTTNSTMFWCVIQLRELLLNLQSIWMKVRAMEEEMSSLKKNHTWELVNQPPGQTLLEQLEVKTTFLHGLVYGRDQWKHVDVNSFIDADYSKDPNKGWSITRSTNRVGSKSKCVSMIHLFDAYPYLSGKGYDETSTGIFKSFVSVYRT
ncbi:hypothetical protein Tco_0109539 [Tanacetum coccineum]